MPVPERLILLAPLQSIASVITIKSLQPVPWCVHRICQEVRAPVSCRASEGGPVVQCWAGK